MNCITGTDLPGNTAPPVKRVARRNPSHRANQAEDHALGLIGRALLSLAGQGASERPMRGLRDNPAEKGGRE